MNILTTGMDQNTFIKYVVPLFNQLAYPNTRFLFFQDKEAAQERINFCSQTGSKLDLMIISGDSGQDAKNSPSFQWKYQEYANLAKNNSELPSIMIVRGNLLGIYNSLHQTHPPNLTCFFSQFRDISKETMNKILKGIVFY